MQRLGSKRKNDVSYAKWGYIFILPFFIAFFIFQLVPMISTFYYSFFEYYRSGLTIIGPNPVGLENYQALFASDFPKYMGNTVIMWLLGFIPQIVISLLLAAWFTDVRLRIRGKQFFKVVIYMPNLIMASAFAMLFFALFSTNGPVNAFLMSAGIIDEPFRFLSSVWGARGLVGMMNFLMWFGNTTILLMAAVMGISPSLFEAAELDGCKDFGVLFRIVLPLSLASLMTIGMFYAVGHWNSYFPAVMYLTTNKSLNPLQIILRQVVLLNEIVENASSTENVMAEGIKYATIVVAMLPMLCVYPFVQRYFVKGVMVGSV